MTAIEIAREYFPDMSDDDLDRLIWAETGFPSFWPDETISVEANFRAQLAAYKAKTDAA